MIRIMMPEVTEDEVESAARVLRSGQLVQGVQVREFEEELAESLGVRHVVAVSSGTAALHLALAALGIGSGDEVAVPSYTWPATANAVALVGGEPSFVDIEPTSFGMDPEALNRVLDVHPRVKAVIPVHAFGGMADISAISDLATQRGLVVIEDAACAIGAEQGGRAAGAWGHAGCLSFHPRKVITTGEGGAVVTDESDLANRIRTLRNHGIDPVTPGPRFILPGYNLRLTEFQAAMGRSQLRRLDAILSTRRALARAYEERFRGSSVATPRIEREGAHTFQSYVILLPRSHAVRRETILAGLKALGIEAAIGTYHVPLTDYYAGRYGFRAGDFPITDDIAARAVTLPLHRELDATAVGRIADAVLDMVSD